MCLARRIYFLELDDSAPHANCNCLGAVAGAEFFHDVLDVDLDGFFGDKKLFSNVSIAVSTCNMIEDFDFARGQVFVTHLAQWPSPLRRRPAPEVQAALLAHDSRVQPGAQHILSPDELSLSISNLVESW